MKIRKKYLGSEHEKTLSSMGHVGLIDSLGVNGKKRKSCLCR